MRKKASLPGSTEAKEAEGSHSTTQGRTEAWGSPAERSQRHCRVSITAILAGNSAFHFLRYPRLPVNLSPARAAGRGDPRRPDGTGCAEATLAATQRVWRKCPPADERGRQASASSSAVHWARSPRLATQPSGMLAARCRSLLTKLCPALHGPVNCSPPGSSLHGISQARTLGWAAVPFSRGSPQPRDPTHICCTAGRLFNAEPPGKPFAF